MFWVRIPASPPFGFLGPLNTKPPFTSFRMHKGATHEWKGQTKPHHTGPTPTASWSKVKVTGSGLVCPVTCHTAPPTQTVEAICKARQGQVPVQPALGRLRSPGCGHRDHQLPASCSRSPPFPYLPTDLSPRTEPSPGLRTCALWEQGRLSQL